MLLAALFISAGIQGGGSLEKLPEAASPALQPS